MKSLTDQELKQLLAKMLPDKLSWYEHKLWTVPHGAPKGSIEVKDTELLSLCRMVEEEVGCDEWYVDHLEKIVARDYHATHGVKFYLLPKFVRDYLMFHASWEQRTEALAKVKGVI